MHDPITTQIEQLLDRRYKPAHPKAEITVLRRNSGSVRLRIIDPDFGGRSKGDRDREVWDLLSELPEDTLAEISMRLLLTPAERSSSFLNAEFDNPVKSML